MIEKPAVIWVAVVSLAWLGGITWAFLRALGSRSDRGGLVFRWLITVALYAGAVAYVVKLDYRIPWWTAAGMTGLFVLWTPAVRRLLFMPWTSIFDGGVEPPKPKPLYSIAQAKRQQGLYVEAAQAVREQLAKFRGDFRGVLLLAQIQAEDMKDLDSAELTLVRHCANPKVSPRQYAAAMTQLADWHLQVEQDTCSARLALERIIERYPESELALMAAQRVAHLEGMDKILEAKRNPRRIVMPEPLPNAGLLDTALILRPVQEDPARLAAQYEQHLAEHPHDSVVREELAVLYADGLQRLDLALRELARMISTPHQPPQRVAHWLNVLANLQIRHGAGYEAVRQTLEKIVTDFPELPAAKGARSRINHLKLEMQAVAAPKPDKKLGVYENNIGLKYGLPPQRAGAPAVETETPAPGRSTGEP